MTCAPLPSVATPTALPVLDGGRGEPLCAGLDIGGTAIKYALVDPVRGTTVGPVRRVPTPSPATPAAVVAALRGVLEELEDETRSPLTGVGVGVPGIVDHGVVRSAAHLDDSWLGVDARRLLAEGLDREVAVLNDADAAGLAEMRFGAACGVDGTVLLITLGTGIGSALLLNGVLVPNTELGHVWFEGRDVDGWAGASARIAENLDWPTYTDRVQRYLSHLEGLVSPDLIVLGGGISERQEQFLPHLELRARVVPAQLRNAAGIVGTGLQAHLAHSAQH
ncbi:polyphosphate glucokinase [Kocuria dechangensis]|uniref:Polyphosphate glucokinase n=1 Tax=Kocuria dechangensis TaxID=1176249 RepID=A0A917GI14_9MICC|nr:ROK family protein [Kocuria dechangensis]GGG47189.1 polyphosphate glucokinase [Kocuria dechangensis]